MAQAADPLPEQGAARALFDEALADMKAGRWTVACPKLERGTLLDRGTGMRHNLALCYEHTGRPASAWSLFVEVAKDAAAQGQPQREQVARAHAAALEPKLSYIVVVVPADSRIDGLEVRRDGQPLAATQWGAKTPVDPGTHAIEAFGPARRTWRKEVSVTQDGETIKVTIPSLVPGSSPGYDSDAGEPARPGLTTTRKVGLVVGGVGVVGIAVGSWLGLRAISRNNESNDLGCVGNECTEAGAAARRSARSDGNLSTIGFAVGAAGLVGGAALWIFGGPSGTSRASIHAGHGTALSGITLQGAW
ncbi:MAG: hypothetical protein HY898_18275 [Deltaproteobacteria bacterium]|nr:hypothetical protein [Deltaproteobacteria bacterium]